ncbi:VOC family protein [Psychromonas ossibalaenae]|uniref:VOC family protein n=1 Tax=Psychromonas ossibalaenae TaxID=444922 RepID=UPI0003628048|nr:VOC family protein [Psychromonas ossibalaenae]
MIRLEHLNLVVKDIQISLAFYQAAFPEWIIRDGGESEWYGKPRNWVHFGDHNLYLTLNDNGEQESRKLTGHQVGIAHFAFEVGDIEGLTHRLQNAGFKPRIRGPEHPFRQNIYFIDPDGNEVEFVQYFSDLTAQRNLNI